MPETRIHPAVTLHFETPFSEGIRSIDLSAIMRQCADAVGVDLEVTPGCGLKILEVQDGEPTRVALMTPDGSHVFVAGTDWTGRATRWMPDVDADGGASFSFSLEPVATSAMELQPACTETSNGPLELDYDKVGRSTYTLKGFRQYVCSYCGHSEERRPAVGTKCVSCGLIVERP